MKRIDCSKAETMVVASLDEGLNPWDKERLDLHLQECERCRRVLDQTIGLLSALRADLPKELEQEFWTRYDSSLEALLRERDLRPRWAFPWAAAGAVLVAAVLLLSIALGTFKQKQQDPNERLVACVDLIEQLAQLYGPTTDEVVATVSVNIEWVSAANALPALYEAGPVWFEVEEDPYQLYQLDYPSEPHRGSLMYHPLRSRTAS